mmetsp:Transcript_38061/g.65273  ORF Transcript_38061/g.65273 Transcript_38061/m.65273 type:complete len:194 (-) Transcript_38061:23-604(-)
MDYDKDWRPRNFRDVSVSLESLGNNTVKGNMVYRGGEFDVLFMAAQHECIGNPKTILNVRAQADKLDTFGDKEIRFIHYPTKNGPRDYDTTNRQIRIWLRDVITCICSLKEQDYPLYIHCRSGKDRTGIVIGVILLLLDIPLDIVVKEYLCSKTGSVSESQIRHALCPFDTPKTLKEAFKKCDIANLRRCLLK